MGKIKAAFFDIDGTLVSFRTHAVPQETKDAICRLRAAGVKVFVATGRMLAMTSVLDDIEFDGYIAYNGALCVDADKRKVIFKHTVPQEELESLVKRLETDRFPVSFMCRNAMYVNYRAQVVLDVAELVHVEPPVEKDPAQIIREDVFQMCIYADDAKLQDVLARTLPQCEGSRWIPQFADVNVKGMNKQAGIDRILEHFNIPLSAAMAFGDGGNDIPMLRHVPYGVAMGNSEDRVKAVADYVTSSVDEGGIVRAIAHYSDLIF